MFIFRQKGKAIVSLFLCLAMMIGFLPGFDTIASAVTPTLTITDLHLTSNFVGSATHPNGSPAGSVKWTATGLSSGDCWGAKVWFTDSCDAATLNSEGITDPTTRDRLWCLTICENDLGTITATSGDCMGDFLWYATSAQEHLYPGVKSAAMVQLYKSGWTLAYSSPWQDAHADCYVEDPVLTPDNYLTTSFKWFEDEDRLSDLGETENETYEAEVFVWEGWNTVPDPYSVTTKRQIMTVSYISDEDWSKYRPTTCLMLSGLAYDMQCYGDYTPSWKTGDKFTLGVEIRKGNTVVKRTPVIRSTVARSDARVRQPSVDDLTWNNEYHSWNLATDNPGDVTFMRSDGSFTFDSLILNGEALVLDPNYKANGRKFAEGTHYALPNEQNITLNWSYLKTLGAGTHEFTLHYTGESAGVAPVDPVLHIVLRGSTVKCTPTVTVTGYDGADITDSCTVTWKTSSGSEASFPVASGTKLTYTAVPGDALKIDGVQYYGTASAEVNFTQETQPVNIALTANGTVTAVPKSGGKDVTGDYTVYWYTKDGTNNRAAAVDPGIDPGDDGSYTRIGSGKTSPMMPAGTVLYCEVIMEGANRDKYDDIEKTAVTVGFGNKSQDIAGGVKNTIGITITNDDITDKDYTVTWYTKNSDGTYRKAAEGSLLTDLQGSVGKVYYYEITPRDYYDYSAGKTVFNWLRFKGVPFDETATKVTVTDEAQTVEVALAPVTMATLSGTVTNGANVGMNNLTFTVSQDPYEGYLNAAGKYSYASKWNSIEFNVNGNDFSAQVWNFYTTLKITEKNNNFRTYYKTIAAADLGTALSFAMSSEDLPGSIPLTITKQYPDGRAENLCGYSTLSRGGWYSDEGIFNDMKFTLVNKTKGNAVIDPSLYQVVPREVQFVGDISGVIEMGDELTLSYTVDKIDGAVDKTSSTVKVLRNYYEAGYDWNSRQFSLSYKDMPNAYFTSPDGYGTWHVIALYNEAGELADTVTDTYYGWTHSVPAGNYTIVNFRRTDWLSAPATLEALQSILGTDEYLSKSITMENGLCTVVNFDASPAVGAHKTFTENSKFSDETVKASVDEWALVKLDFEVDPAIAKANPGSQYAITVKTTMQSGHTIEQDVIPRFEPFDFGVAKKDKYISVYHNNKLVDDSTVKINAYDAQHLGTIKGFTLYTTETSGEIWFYIQAPKGGDFPITAAGARIVNDREVNALSFGNMTFAVTAAGSSLNFDSDYLRTSDNGTGSINYNRTWIYTTPNSDVKLYMDGVEIDSTKSNSAGVASFAFAMTDSKVGKTDVTTFRTNERDWTVAGTHELYATATKNNSTLRSAVTTMECVTKANFTPAAVKSVKVKSISDNEKDSFSGQSHNLLERNYYSRPTITNYYWSLNDKGNVFTYEFTVEMEDANNVADEGMLLTVTGQNGEEYYTMLERVEGTNKFVGSVSDEKLLFTNWAVSVKSKLPETIDASNVEAGIDDLIAKYGANYKIVNPDTGAEQTLQQYYDYIYNDYVNTYSENQELLREAQEEAVDIFLEAMRSYDEYLDGPSFDYSTFDGSEESIKALKAHFGIYEGVYADIPEGVWSQSESDTIEQTMPDGTVILLNAPAPYTETTGADGRVYRAVTTKEIDSNGHLIEVQYSAALPLNGDEGYSYIQGVDLGLASESWNNADADNKTFNRYNAGATVNKLGGGEEKHFPTMSRGSIGMLGQTGQIFGALHERINGTKSRYGNSLAGQRAAMGIGAIQNDHRSQTKAQMNTQSAINGILDNPRIDGETRQQVTECKDLIDDICRSTSMSDFSQAIKYTMQNINNVVNTIHDLKEGIVDASTNGLKALKDRITGAAADAAREATRDAIEAATGVKLPLDVVEACSDLLDAYSSGLLSEAEKKTIELYLKAQALAKKHNVRVPGDKTKGGSGIGGRSSGGSARATHDPEGIIYEAVLSNPVEGATATLYERNTTSGDITVWDAENYGQINPQVTNGSGWYQWFVPEGEWQVRVTAPEGSGLSDNTSADNPAANLDDGSTKGWLPVMPVQLGINIPLVSTASPALAEATISPRSAEVVFSLYMDASQINDDAFTVKYGDKVVPCRVIALDAESDPMDPTKQYVKTVRLEPTGTEQFRKGVSYSITAAAGLTAYNGKSAAAAMTLGNLTMDGEAPAVEGTVVTVGANGCDYKSIAAAITAINKLIKAKTADEAYNLTVSDGHVETAAVTIPKSDVKFAITGGAFTMNNPKITANSDLTILAEINAAKASANVTVAAAAGVTVNIPDLRSSNKLVLSGTKTSAFILDTLTVTELAGFTGANLTVKSGTVVKLEKVTGFRAEKIDGEGMIDVYDASALTASEISGVGIVLNQYNKVSGKNVTVMLPKLTVTTPAGITLTVRTPEGADALIAGQTVMQLGKNNLIDGIERLVTITNKDGANALSAVQYGREARAEWLGTLTLSDGEVNIPFSSFEKAFERITEDSKAIDKINAENRPPYKSYTVTMNTGVTPAKFALPAKCASLTIDGGGNDLTLVGITSISPKYAFTLTNVKLIDAHDKNGRPAALTINNTSAALTISDIAFTGKSLTLGSTKAGTENVFSGITTADVRIPLNINGGAKNYLTISGCPEVFSLSGFDRITLAGDIRINKALTTNTLDLGDSGNIITGSYVSGKRTVAASITVKKLLTGQAGSRITFSENFKAITLSGAASGSIALTGIRIPAATQIFNAPKCALGVFDVTAVQAGDGNYALTRTGSKVCCQPALLDLGGRKFVKFSDIANEIETDGTAGDYTITLDADLDSGAALKFPKAGTYSTIRLDLGGHKLTFTGNVSLTGDTVIENGIFRAEKLNAGTKEYELSKYTIASAKDKSLTVTGVSLGTVSSIGLATSRVTLKDVTFGTQAVKLTADRLELGRITGIVESITTNTIKTFGDITVKLLEKKTSNVKTGMTADSGRLTVKLVTAAGGDAALKKGTVIFGTFKGEKFDVDIAGASLARDPKTFKVTVNV